MFKRKLVGVLAVNGWIILDKPQAPFPLDTSGAGTLYSFHPCPPRKMENDGKGIKGGVSKILQKEFEGWWPSKFAFSRIFSR